MGIRGAGRDNDQLQLWQRRRPALRLRAIRRSRFAIPLARRLSQRQGGVRSHAGGNAQAQRMGPFRYAWQRLGMGCRLLDARCAGAPDRCIRFHAQGGVRGRCRSRWRLARRIQKAEVGSTDAHARGIPPLPHWLPCRASVRFAVAGWSGSPKPPASRSTGRSRRSARRIATLAMPLEDWWARRCAP